MKVRALMGRLLIHSKFKAVLPDDEKFKTVIVSRSGSAHVFASKLPLKASEKGNHCLILRIGSTVPLRLQTEEFREAVFKPKRRPLIDANAPSSRTYNQIPVI